MVTESITSKMVLVWQLNRHRRSARCSDGQYSRWYQDWVFAIGAGWGMDSANPAELRTTALRMIPDSGIGNCQRSVSVIDVDALALIACERFDMLQRFHWLIVPVELLLFVSCTTTQGDEPVAATDSAEPAAHSSRQRQHNRHHRQQHRKRPLVTTSEPQSVGNWGVEIRPRRNRDSKTRRRQKNRKFRRTGSTVLLGYETNGLTWLQNPSYT